MFIIFLLLCCWLWGDWKPFKPFKLFVSWTTPSLFQQRRFPQVLAVTMDDVTMTGGWCGLAAWISPVFHVPVTMCSEVWKPFCWYKYQCDIWYPPSKERRYHHGRSMNITKQCRKILNSSVKYFIFLSQCSIYPCLVLT